MEQHRRSRNRHSQRRRLTPIERSTDVARALDRVAQHLAARDHSVHELRTKLLRWFQPAAVEAALADAKASGWLVEPAVLAERFTESLSRKGKSHQYIQGTLKKRGLPATQRDEDSEVAKGVRCLRQKFPEGSKISFELRAKAYRFLAYRGFEASVIKKAIDEFNTDIRSGSLEFY